MKEHRKVRGLLDEWYGDEVARGEIVAYGHQLKSIEYHLDKLCSSVFSQDLQYRMSLSESWREVVGPQLATLTTPGGFSEGVLDIEVRHAAFLRELDSTKDIIIGQVNSFLKAKVCSDIRFVPSSGRGKKV